MPDIKLPLLSGEDPEHYSEKTASGCAVCSEACYVPDSYLELYGGLSSYTGDPNFPVSLGLISHSTSKSTMQSTHIEIVNVLKEGQFRIRFCSKKCLRLFFESLLSKIPDSDH